MQHDAKYNEMTRHATSSVQGRYGDHYHHGGAFMTVRAGRIVGDKAAPYGGMRAMGAIAADLARVHDGTRTTQLELGYQRTADGQAMVNLRGELDIATA